MHLFIFTSERFFAFLQHQVRDKALATAFAALLPRIASKVEVTAPSIASAGSTSGLDPAGFRVIQPTINACVRVRACVCVSARVCVCVCASVRFVSCTCCDQLWV
jgi:hypothetical protein